MTLVALSMILPYFMHDWTKDILPPNNLKQLISTFNIELTDEDKTKIKQLVAKPFYYLDEGGQSYVFCSSDGKYVLKFFKFHHLTPEWYLNLLPQYWKRKITARLNKKKRDLINGYCLANKYLKEESGLVFLKMDPVPLSFPVTLVKDGKERQIELSNIPFAIQKRALQISDIFSSHLAQGDQNAVKEKIEKILKLYLEDYAKGLCDRDHGVMHNMGFFNDKTPMHLDLGRLVKDEMIKDITFSVHDFYKVANKMREWIQKNFPEHSQSLGMFIDDCLETNLANPTIKKSYTKEFSHD